MLNTSFTFEFRALNTAVRNLQFFIRTYEARQLDTKRIDLSKKEKWQKMRCGDKFCSDLEAGFSQLFEIRFPMSFCSQNVVRLKHERLKGDGHLLQRRLVRYSPH